jgi:DNA primase
VNGPGVFGTLRERIDLVEITKRYTELSPSGRGYVGRCPFPDHEDKTPSFYLFPDRRFHCFGCGRSGDATDLWAAANDIEDGITAALDLARAYGIELPSRSPEAQRLIEERRLRETEHLENAKGAHDALRQHPIVTEWWEGRGFDEDLRQRFLLGAHEGSAIIPFWNRGRVQGFIRRNLQGEPKYLLQKAEKFVPGYRPLFVPGPVSASAFLVEGYIDALALVALGYSAIAVGGTGISDRQMEELRRLPGSLYVLPDADESGRKAAREWVEKLYPKALLCPPNYEKEEHHDDD